MKKLSLALIALLCGQTFALSAAQATSEAPPPEKERPLVQIALLLDTSGSMSGMINQARNQLWAIVNEFIAAERDGVRPRLEVSLLHYGSPALGKENGYVRMLQPLTEDLDAISEDLFALTTGGGDEYCGWVIRTAINELNWSASTRDYKAVFIAGNEPFSQGPVDFRTVCKSAIEKGIIVNTIHCSGGSDQDWRDGAILADGKALKIDTNRAVVEIETPFDAEIAALNTKLNGTYIAYGAKGRKAQERQAEVDQNASSFGYANVAKRALSKSSTFYSNESWDLVDAENKGRVDVATMKEDELPEELKRLPKEERSSYIDKKRKERTALQAKIQKLSKQRDAFITKSRAELASNDETLGEQVKSTVKDQAEATGFSFK